MPSTTIGSFPPTTKTHSARATFKRGKLNAAGNEQAMKADIEQVIRQQKALDIDVLLYGEAERNDMETYFGEQLDGSTFTEYS